MADFITLAPPQNLARGLAGVLVFVPFGCGLVTAGVVEEGDYIGTTLPAIEGHETPAINLFDTAEPAHVGRPVAEFPAVVRPVTFPARAQ